MALLQVAHELVGSFELKIALKFLKREHNAKISKPKDLFYCIEYEVEGDDIPVGNKYINIAIRTIVPNVLAITIE